MHVGQDRLMFCNLQKICYQIEDLFFTPSDKMLKRDGCTSCKARSFIDLCSSRSSSSIASFMRMVEPLWNCYSVGKNLMDEKREPEE